MSRSLPVLLRNTEHTRAVTLPVSFLPLCVPVPRPAGALQADPEALLLWWWRWWAAAAAECVALLPHSKKVVGSSPASCNMSGLVPGPFCVEFACSPRVHPGSPHRTPTIKTCKKSRCSSVLSLTKTGPSTWTWSPGAASLAAHCSWLSLGEDARMGKSREHLPPSSHLHVCVCVCVCVSPLTMCVTCVHAVWQ